MGRCTSKEEKNIQKKTEKVRIKVKFCTRIITQTSYMVPEHIIGICRYLRTVYLASRICHCREDLQRRKGQKNVHQSCQPHFAQTFSGPLPFPWSFFLYSILSPFQVITFWCTKAIMAYVCIIFSYFCFSLLFFNLLYFCSNIILRCIWYIFAF